MGDIWREKKLRSQLLTRLKSIGLYMVFVERERRRMMKIFDALLEKYWLFLLQRQRQLLFNGKCFFSPV